MGNIIFGCIIANLLTIAVIFFVAYLLYRKNEKKIEAVKSAVESKIEGVKSTIAETSQRIENIVEVVGQVNSALGTLKDAIESIKDKFPFKASTSSRAKKEDK